MRLSLVKAFVLLLRESIYGFHVSIGQFVIQGHAPSSKYPAPTEFIIGALAAIPFTAISKSILQYVQSPIPMLSSIIFWSE